MAAKKAKKTGKALGKKDMKKTKGGVLIGLNQPGQAMISSYSSPTVNGDGKPALPAGGGLNQGGGLFFKY
jgi:hypothetical protein